MIQQPVSGYSFFQRKVAEVVGLDLTQYRPEQMERRLRGFVARFAGETFFTLARRLERDAEFAAQVRDFLTINVSEFFRNPDRFAQLQTLVLPQLCAHGRVRIWSAGCSIGAEPYSLAILLHEVCQANGMVWATDIDPQALDRARCGLYRPNELQSVDRHRLARYFRHADEGYEVRPEVRALVTFRVHNLLQDEFSGTWDLIVCRNVVIYFTTEARAGLYRRFREVLRPGGVLFIGGTESILDPAHLGLEPVAPFFYRRAD